MGRYHFNGEPLLFKQFRLVESLYTAVQTGVTPSIIFITDSAAEIVDLNLLRGRAIFATPQVISRYSLEKHNTCLAVKNPRLAFCKELQNCFSTVLVHNQKHWTVGQNTVIGGPGFGFEKDDDGTVYPFPHFGDVVIGTGTRIGSNTCIDRGALTDTVIGQNVWIDNLVHIAHGAQIGDGSVIVAGAVVCGSAKIGKNVWIGPNATIREGVTIGDNAFIGMDATVTKDVAPGERVLPAYSRRDDGV